MIKSPCMTTLKIAKSLLCLLGLVIVGSLMASVAVKRDLFTGVSLLLGLPWTMLLLLVNSSTEIDIDFDALARGIDAERERQANDRRK